MTFSKRAEFDQVRIRKGPLRFKKISRIDIDPFHGQGF